MNRFEKSTLPITTPMGGIRTSVTSEVTILPNAAPITMPIAKSSTFPRMMNSLNSLNIDHLRDAHDSIRAATVRSREKFKGTGRRRSRLGKRALPNRDREGVGALVFGVHLE